MTFVELQPGSLAQPSDLVSQCFEGGVEAILIPEGALPAEFFDLSSGVAGETVQKVVNYGLRMAAIVPDLSTRQERFQEFAREANRGARFSFFPDRAAAVAWLESE